VGWGKNHTGCFRPQFGEVIRNNMGKTETAIEKEPDLLLVVGGGEGVYLSSTQTEGQTTSERTKM